MTTKRIQQLHGSTLLDDFIQDLIEQRDALKARGLTNVAVVHMDYYVNDAESVDKPRTITLGTRDDGEGVTYHEVQPGPGGLVYHYDEEQVVVVV